MSKKELKLVCPKCRNNIGYFVNYKFIVNEGCSSCSNKYDNIANVPNLRIQVDKNENLNLLDESKTLPKQNSFNSQIPFIQEALQSDELILELGAGVDRCDNPNLIKTDAYLYSTDLHCLADAHSLPFEDNTFGYVYSLAVFEHLHSPWIAADEIYRVLKPGGKVYTLTAFMQHMHGYPHHYFNMTTSGLARIFQSFEITSCEPSKHSSILQLAYILADLNNIINNSKFSSKLQKEASLLGQNIHEFCKIVPNLDEEIMENIEHQKINFSKISPAIELIAIK
jgi:SAM-dependent methyltransferase